MWALDLEQQRAPTGPKAPESDPTHSIERRHNGSLTFWLEGTELHPQADQSEYALLYLSISLGVQIVTLGSTSVHDGNL